VITPERVSEIDDETLRRSTLMVTNICTRQHECTGAGCEHRNHRRDIDYARHCLETLGLMR
jgi:hypothetical protein